MRSKLKVKDEGNKKFYYIDVGSETHYRKSFRLWINRQLIKNEQDYFIIEGKNREIIITEKGNYVLKKSDNYNVFDIGWECGFRGESYYEIVNTDNIINELKYSIYNSQRGSTGISRYALVTTNSNQLIVNLSRNGRLYGNRAKLKVEYYFDNDNNQKYREVIDEELAELLD